MKGTFWKVLGVNCDKKAFLKGNCLPWYKCHSFLQSMHIMHTIPNTVRKINTKHLGLSAATLMWKLICIAWNMHKGIGHPARPCLEKSHFYINQPPPPLPLTGDRLGQVELAQVCWPLYANEPIWPRHPDRPDLVAELDSYSSADGREDGGEEVPLTFVES